MPLKPNVEWVMDFMSDALINGKKIRTLNIIDHYITLAVNDVFAFACLVVISTADNIIAKAIRSYSDNYFP